MRSNINGVSRNDYYILSAAATGAAINQTDNAEDLKSTLLWGGAFMGAPAVISGGTKAASKTAKWVKENKNDLKTGLTNVYKDTVGKTNIFAENRKALKGNLRATINDNYYRQLLKEIKLPAMDLTKAQGIKTAEIYKDVIRLLEEAKTLKGDALVAKVKEIQTAITTAKIAIQNAKAAGEITRTTRAGKLFSWLKTKTGARKVQTKILEGTMSKNKFIKILSKSAKAGASMFVLSAAMETVCNIIPTYKTLGKEQGKKQLGKSLTKVAADTVGFAIGTKLGGIAGAKAGAAIGTCIGGPVGTLIGGVAGTIIGIGCGLLGSWLARKGTEKLVGKDELIKAQDEQTQAIADAAATDPELQLELAAQAQQNIQDGLITDKEDIKTVTESIDRVATAAQTTQAETPADSTLADTATPATGVITKDAGMNALYSLAQGQFTSNSNPMSYMNTFNTMNPFMTMNYNMMNPFMNNPFMFNVNNAMNYNMMNYSNPFMPFGMMAA